MTLWAIILVVFGVLVILFQKKMHFSEKYLKQCKKVQLQGLWLIGGCILIFVGSIFVLLSEDDKTYLILGMPPIMGGILLIIYYIIKFKEDRKKLKEMYKKEEQEQLYRDELIKERAKLRVKKELNKK